VLIRDGVEGGWLEAKPPIPRNSEVRIPFRDKMRVRIRGPVFFVHIYMHYDFLLLTPQSWRILLLLSLVVDLLVSSHIYDVSRTVSSMRILTICNSFQKMRRYIDVQK
jgi:hypothetical protein